MTSPLRAISLWQPWASAIALGHKSIETRHWTTKHRGELAIHAAKVWTPDQREFAAAERSAGRIPWGLPFGAIVAVAEIVDIKRTEMLVDQISEIEALYGNYRPKRFGWMLERIRPLREPVPCAGRQSMWTLDEATSEAVRSRL